MKKLLVALNSSDARVQLPTICERTGVTTISDSSAVISNPVVSNVSGSNSNEAVAYAVNSSELTRAPSSRDPGRREEANTKTHRIIVDVDSI